MDRLENAESQHNDWGHDTLVVSTACMVLLFSMFAVSTALLICKIPVTWLNGALSLGITFFYVATQARRKLVCTITTLALIGSAVVISSLFYDQSWDGNAYHKLSIGLIRMGWNPVYQPLGEFANNSGLFVRQDWAVGWVGFPKASYIIGANLYALTGSIESAKAFTLISLACSIGCIAVFAKEIGRLSRFQGYCVSSLLSINSVTLSQVFTTMNDGFLSLMVFIAAFSFLYVGLSMDGKFNRYAYWLIFMSTCIGVNLKYSGLVLFTLLFGAFGLVLILAKLRHGNSQLAQRLSIQRYLSFVGGTAVCAFVILGATSYVYGAVHYKNPVYPLLSQSAMNSSMNDPNSPASPLPAALRGSSPPSPVQTFALSLFSRVGSNPELKMPFTVYRSEIKPSIRGGASVGGWGIWFSGILLLSLAAFFSVMGNLDRRLKVAFFFIAGLAILPTFVIPFTNLARYWFMPFAIPAIALVLLFSTRDPKSVLAKVLAALLSLNIALPLVGLVVQAKGSIDARQGLRTLAGVTGAGGHVTVSLGLPTLSIGGTPEFSGMLFNLRDAGITNFHLVEPSEVAKVPGKATVIPLGWSPAHPNEVSTSIYYVIN